MNVKWQGTVGATVVTMMDDHTVYLTMQGRVLQIIQPDEPCPILMWFMTREQLWNRR